MQPRYWLVVLAVIFSAPGLAGAQAFTPMRPESTSEEVSQLRRDVAARRAVGRAGRETNDNRSARRTAEDELLTKENEEDTGADFLRQAGFNFGTASNDVTLQAADLFFSRRVRFFLRTTVPVEQEEEEPAAAVAAPAAEVTGPTIDDNISAALSSPYAGLVYATVGFLPRLHKGGLSLGRPEDQYGLFLDTRVGLKAVEIPREAAKSDGKHDLTPFYTASFGVRVQLPLFNDDALTSQAGDFGLAVLGVWNHATDTSVSDLFKGDDPKLKADTGSVHVSAAIVLSKIAYLSLDGTAWTSSSLGRRWTLGINLLKESK